MPNLDKITMSMEWPVNLNELVTIRTHSGIELRIPYQIPIFAENVTKNATTDLEKLIFLHEWVVQNIEYDPKSHKQFEQLFGESFFPNPITALKYKRGVCHDMTHVILSAGISLGLDTRRADILIDVNGKKVNHCCPIIKFENMDVFIDPAYKGFDVQHQKCIVFSELETIIEIQDALAHPYLVRGNFYFEKKDYIKAANYFDVCSYINPYKREYNFNKAAAYNNLGVLSLGNGNSSEAAIFFDMAIESDPNNITALRNKSNTSFMECY